MPYQKKCSTDDRGKGKLSVNKDKSVIKLSLKKINGLCTAFNFHNWHHSIIDLSLYWNANRFLKMVIN